MKSKMIGIIAAILVVPVSANAWIPSTSKLAPEISTSTTSEENAAESKSSREVSPELAKAARLPFRLIETTVVRARR